MKEKEIKRILITGRLYEQLGEVIGNLPSKELKFLPEEEITEEVLKWADAFVAFRPTENFNFYNLKWVHALGAGVDSFLSSRQWKTDVILTRTICSFGTKISEYCLSYMLANLQQHQKLQKFQEDNKWGYAEPIALKSRKVLILGTGVIGQELAKNLNVLGVKPLGVSRSGEPKKYFERVIKFEDIGGILSGINWMINTLPLTEETVGIINKDIFDKMKNVCFINVGRGKSVNESDLINAINYGNLQLAVLDVFQREPLPVESELWNNPKIIITPHIAAITPVDEAAKCFLDTLQAVEDNSLPLANQIDCLKGY